MTLERLVEEIRTRAERELATQDSKLAAETTRITADRDRRVQQVREEADRLSQIDVARERAQKVAAAKLEARKLGYLAREKQSTAGLEAVRQMLAEFTGTSEYPKVLERMYDLATDQLGKPLKVFGRAEDASTLRSIAGKGFDPTPMPVLGGLIAESAQGARRLTLTFDELLRLQEDQVRGLLSS